MLEEHYLKPLFEPESVAVFGASDREDSVGQVLFANLLQTGLGGRLFPINPKHEVVQGQQTFKSLHDVPGRVDLAIICTPAMSVPGIIEQCGERGVRFALIVSSGFAERGHAGAALERKVLEIARSYSVRILGPNSLGIMRPPGWSRFPRSRRCNPPRPFWVRRITAIVVTGVTSPAISPR